MKIRHNVERNELSKADTRQVLINFELIQSPWSQLQCGEIELARWEESFKTSWLIPVVPQGIFFEVELPTEGNIFLWLWLPRKVQ